MVLIINPPYLHEIINLNCHRFGIPRGRSLTSLFGMRRFPITLSHLWCVMRKMDHASMQPFIMGLFLCSSRMASGSIILEFFPVALWFCQSIYFFNVITNVILLNCLICCTQLGYVHWKYLRFLRILGWYVRIC